MIKILIDIKAFRRGSKRGKGIISIKFGCITTSANSYVSHLGGPYLKYILS